MTDITPTKTHRDENFPVASLLIAPRHRATILAFYRFVRAADDVADSAVLSAPEKVARLDRLEAGLLGQENAGPEVSTLRNALAARNLSPRHAQDLLAEVLAGDGVRTDLLRELERDYAVQPPVLRQLEGLQPAALAATLIEGIRLPPNEADAGRRQFFALNPVPNYFFQRDPQVVLGNRLVVSSMANDAREREPLLARTIFAHHPALADVAATFEIEVPPSGAPQHDSGFPYPTLEGGDVLVVNSEIVMVGLSERTNRRGVETLAEYLRLEETSFRHMVVVELPHKRAYMHLDTVFTLIDRGLCLAHLPVVEPGGPESAHVYSVDLYARELTFTLRAGLLRTLAELGVELSVVPCGGALEAIDQQREQWTDGANAFALAPGVVLLYQRNRKTIAELARRGFRVLGGEEVAAGREDLMSGGPAVVTLWSNELSRARGGPRCMTMPLERERV